MAAQNLFKKVSVFMKKNPKISRKEAFEIVQGKKKAPASKMGSAKKTVKVSIAGKKAPSSPLTRQGGPVNAKMKALSLALLERKMVEMLKIKLGALEVNKFMAKTIRERDRLAKEIAAVKKQLRKFL
jgi:hypothetical protein